MMKNVAKKSTTANGSFADSSKVSNPVNGKILTNNHNISIDGSSEIEDDDQLLMEVVDVPSTGPGMSNHLPAYPAHGSTSDPIQLDEDHVISPTIRAGDNPDNSVVVLDDEPEDCVVIESESTLPPKGTDGKTSRRPSNIKSATPATGNVKNNKSSSPKSTKTIGNDAGNKSTQNGELRLANASGCILCGGFDDFEVLCVMRKKGLATVIRSSLERKDDKHLQWGNEEDYVDGTLKIHNKCRTEYTNPKKFSQTFNRAEEVASTSLQQTSVDAGKTKVNGNSSTPANKTLNDKKKSDLSESASLGAFLQCDSDDDDDEVIVCEKDKEDSGTVLSKSDVNGDKSKTASTKSSGPICRVENCDIYENGQEAPEMAEPLVSKANKRSNQNDKEVVEVVEDDIEMTEVLNDAGGDFVITTNNDDTVARMNNACSKRLRLDSPAAESVQLKKSRLEVAESEILTTMCAKNQTISSPLSAKPNSKSITRSSKEFKELILACMEDYVNKTENSLIAQLQLQIEELKLSREQWKTTAIELRTQITEMQASIQQKTDRRRACNKVQLRNVGCQVSTKSDYKNMEKAKPGAKIRTNSASSSLPQNFVPNSSLTAVSSSSQTGQTTQLAQMPPSVLPPASATALGTQNLRILHNRLQAPLTPMQRFLPPGYNLQQANSSFNSFVTPQQRLLMSPQNMLPAGSVMMTPPVTTIPVRHASSNAPNQGGVIDLTDEDDQIRQEGQMQLQSQQALVLPNGTQNARLGIPGGGNTIFLFNPGVRIPNPSTTNSAAFNNCLRSLSVNGMPPSSMMQDINNIRGQFTLTPVHQTMAQMGQIANLRPQAALTAPPAPKPTVVQPSVRPVEHHHPAPLPALPSQTSPPTAKELPPKPSLKLTRVAQGIVLSWNATMNSLQEEATSYQLFAYQQGSDPPTCQLWKKVGNVKALALPMACTLTQFQVGNRYHFAVRAVDQHNRVGPFSEPGSIHLEASSA